MGLITGNLRGASSMDFATQVSRVISRGHSQGALHGLLSHTVITICCRRSQATKSVTGICQKKAVAPVKNSLKYIPI